MPIALPPGLCDTVSLPHLVERSGLEPDKPAVVFDGRTRTYGELRDASRRVANALIGLGLDELDRVAVLSTNRLEFIEIEIGIAAARDIMVPLNWRLRSGELANLLRRSRARAIFVEDRFLPTIAELRAAGEVPDLRTIVAVDSAAGDLSYEELVGSAPASRPARRGRVDDPHEIVFTSGTTGEAKGVVWTNGGVLFNALQQVVDFRLGPEHATYAVIDLYYIGGRHAFTLPTLYQGGTVHVKPSGGFDARAVVRYVAEHGITHVLWVPTMLYEILPLPELSSLEFDRLQMIMAGGQPVSAAMTRRAQAAFPGADFVQVYGLTEGGAALTHVRPRDVAAKPGSAGQPSLHVELRLAGPGGADVADGSDGEILVRAPSVAAGYWGDPDLTAATIRDGWLHTGDMGRVDADGFLYISGRKSDMIISGGMNIFPEEIEGILREHPTVADVAVIGLPDERWGETVCAVVVPVDGAEVEEDMLVDHCVGRLASYKKPTRVCVVDELPRTPSGKPRKMLLRERLA